MTRTQRPLVGDALVALAASMVIGTLIAVPAVSAQSSVPPSSGPGATGPAPLSSGPPPSGDPMADLWLGTDPLVRVDGTTGALLGTIATTVEHCAWKTSFGPSEGVIWLSSGGKPGYLDPMSQAMGQVVDPDEVFCIARVPLDGSAAQVFTVDVPEGAGLFPGGGTILDGVLWATYSLLPPDGGSVGGGNTSLYRLDPAVGSLEQVVPGVLDVAAAGGRLFIIEDSKKTGFPRAGVIEPGSTTTQTIDLGLKRDDSVDVVEAGDDHVLFLGLKGQGGIAYLVDTAGSLTGTTKPLGKSGFGFLRGSVGTEGAFLVGPDLKGLGFAPHQQGAKVTLIGAPCVRSTKPNKPSCQLSLVGTTPGAVWVMRSSYAPAGGKQVYERYDTATMALTARVDAASVSVDH